MRTNLRTIFDAAVSNNDTINSTKEDISHLYGYYIEVTYTGATLAGTAKVQTSADGLTWRDAPDSGATAHHSLSASGGNVQWNVDAAYYAFVRVSFTTDDANAATVTGKIYTKGF